VNRNTSTLDKVTSGCGEQVNDVLDGLIGFVVCGFEFAIGPMRGIGFVMKAAVGQRTAETFVKKQEQESDLEAFSREAVGVTAAVALEQPVTFEFAQIITELVQPVCFVGKSERGEDGSVNLFGRPAPDSIAAMQQNLQ